MNKLKKAMRTVVDMSSRPAEGWRFLRQTVRELHVLLRGVTSLVGELEERLDRLEAAATGRAPRASAPAAPRKSTRKRAPRKTPARAKRASAGPRA